MSLSSAAVSPERARSSRSAGADRRRWGRAPADVLALRALVGGRFGITIPAPDLEPINRSISAPRPFNPQPVAFRLAATGSAFGAWWDHMMLDHSEHTGHRTSLGILGQRAADVRRT